MIKNYINLLMLSCTVLFSMGAIAQNGDCSSATPIGEGTFTDPGILASGAGLEGASNNCFTGGTDAVWYSYTASATNIATVSSSIDLDQPDTRVSIYTGTCDDLTCLASDDDSGNGFTTLVTFDVVAGETYLMEWDDRWDDGEFDFEIFLGEEILDCPDIPANIGDACDDENALTFDDVITADCVCMGTPFDCPDIPANIGDACDDGNADTSDDVLGDDCICAGSPILTGPNATCDGALAIGEGIILDADIGGGEGASNVCFTGATNSIYYAYTASADGEATISSSIDLDEPDTRVSVYSSCDMLECIASDDDSGEGFTTLTSFAATGGSTYIIEWDDRWDDGVFDFEITLLTDVVLGCTDEEACNYNPLANSDDASCLFIGGGCDDGDAGTFDDIIGDDCMCSGTPFECPDVPGNIGDDCDDGDAATVNDIIGDDCVCLGEPFVVAPNALCADAIAIGEGTILAADISGGEGSSNNCFTGATNSIWYAYTASANGTATVSSSIDLDTPDTRVSIYTGPCDDLTCLASDDDSGEGFTTLISFDAAMGATYLIEWDDRWDDGEFDFEITIAGIVSGCTNVDACNYDETATDDDGSCYLVGDACDDNDPSTNGDVWTDCDTCAGSIDEVPGCTNADACNYNPAATEDDGTCLVATGCDECDGEGGVIDNLEVGEACDDGDETTINDMIGDDCICVGEGEPSAPNALCGDAIAISEGTVLAANISGGEGAANICFESGGVHALWYAYTASEDGVATISSSIDLDTPDTRVSVYAGACDDLTCLAFDDDGGDGFTSLLSFDVTGGDTYLVEWDDRWDDGEFDFEIFLGDEVFDCPEIEANIGDLCDDGDAATENDSVGEDCICAGTLIVFDCPDLMLNIGNACDDGDATTINDTVTDACECVGEVVVVAPNALCGDVIAIGEGTVLAADISGGEGAANACFEGSGVNALWYAYTASEDGVATVSSSIDLDTPDTRVSIYTGTCDDLTCLAFDDDGGEAFTSLISFDVTGGDTYLVEWDDRWDDGEFDFEITLDTSVEVLGCTNEDACNYNEAATEDDGSCLVATGCDECDGEGGVIDNPDVGESCDDGDAETTNDMIVSCGVCMGTVPGDCEDVDPSMWGSGPWYPVSQGSFVAESANDAVLAKGDGDLAIEIFTGECGGMSIGLYNTVGAGPNEIERIVVGDLVAGTTYYYSVTGGSNIMSKVKTYAHSRLEDFDCDVDQALIDQIYALREESMYSNPAVQVTGFAFRFQDVSTSEVIELVDATVDGFYQQLSTIPGIENGHSYSVTVRHRVLQIANGAVANLWSDYGTPCIVNVTSGGGFADNGNVASTMDPFNNSLDATVYPNPNNGDQVYLELVNFEESNVVVTVFDMYGKNVFSEQFTSTGSVMTKELNFNSDLSSGIYLVQLTTGGQSVTQKLTVN